MFSMLENSQMRENMLLQYADDIIKVEIGSLRGEMLRLVRTSIVLHLQSQTSGWFLAPGHSWTEAPAPPACVNICEQTGDLHT